MRLAPAILGSFVALVPAEPAPALRALADAAVRRFEAFRAPLDPADRDRRLAGGLTERQRDHLLRWGYPYVFEEFFFHMTLSGPLCDPPDRRRLSDAFARFGADALAEPLTGMVLAVFRQPDRGQPFTIIGAWPLRGAAAGQSSSGQSSSGQSSSGRSGS